MGKLTVKGVEALTEPGRYSDGDGLHLRIDSQRRRYWVLRVQVDGQRKDVNLGPARRLTLAKARAAAADVRGKISDGSPLARASKVEAPTFEEAARKVYAARASGWRNAKHGHQWIKTLETYAFPLIGTVRVNALSRGDVSKVLSPIWLEKPETARRVMQRLDTVIRWAAGNNYRESAVDMKIVREGLPKQKAGGRHMPAMDWRAVPGFYRSVDTSTADPLTRAALKWLVLNVPRPGNVALMRLEQVDADAAIWAVPASEMKMERPHRFPLAPASVQLLATVSGIAGRPYLFGVGRDRMSADTLRMAMRRMGTDATPHGFRSSFKDWSLANGYEDHLSEAQLAHADKDKVRAAYARGDLLE